MRYEHGKGLVPVNPWEWEALDLYPKDKDLWVSVRRKRSNVQHSLYWVMLGEVIDSGATAYQSTADLHKALKIELGCVKYLKRLNGDVILEPDSIAFERMDQTEFNRFFDGAKRLIAEHYGIDLG